MEPISTKTESQPPVGPRMRVTFRRRHYPPSTRLCADHVGFLNTFPMCAKGQNSKTSPLRNCRCRPRWLAGHLDQQSVSTIPDRARPLDLYELSGHQRRMAHAIDKSTSRDRMEANGRQGSENQRLPRHQCSIPITNQVKKNNRTELRYVTY